MNHTVLDHLIVEKAIKIMGITENTLCTHCWGRIFSDEIDCDNNNERGGYVDQILIENTLIDNLNNESCYICHDIFQSLENGIMDYIEENIKNFEIEFSTFLVGCRLPTEIMENEKFVYNKMDLGSESIKKELNREIGKLLSSKMNREVDFENPNLVIIIDFSTSKKIPKLELQVNPLFIEGRYRKLLRGIPQTKWSCNKCHGKGCKHCNYTGKLYAESVEEIISPQILKAAHGTNSKFHGAGREDIDVRMLGNGRPFVIEIKEPRKRTLNLENLTKEINECAAGKVEVSFLKLVSKKRRMRIKTSSTETYKTYRALVNLDKEVTNEDLKILNSLNIIKQRTPLRVSHRRADLIRNRRIRDLQIKKLNQKNLELIIECEGGLYIKELITGDEDRTKPNISALLQTAARCVELDVLDVEN